MPTTATICVRVDTRLKARAESVLERLGIDPDDAIRLFYSQVA